ncbi:GNAT family N-acetyltransferase [Oscillochloris sp. ZM17-4]|uniref:GNAT family N-acetyltransferase n=1 Tax=Oscillochloris sp. ZM17-4 TaxID=2866714 RepID=UPI001C73C82A|nr:GNAT family N-acetyltransferase [Oscillochloris sp. ZM17-4]MBX0326436.1 GNAT family N-acetyltransferase [Oscillochloris sp. ZM17-4]
MELRLLARDEIALVWTIDRREVIDHVYYLRDGVLVLQPEHYDMQGWPPGEAEMYTPLLLACYERGGVFTGAFDDATLAGVVVVDTVWRGPQRNLLQLEFLHVSRPYRGQGLGRRLFAHAQAVASARGASGLYVSATPSEHTIHFYQRLGCQVIAEPDPELFAREPEDIHLVCWR